MNVFECLTRDHLMEQEFPKYNIPEDKEFCKIIVKF